MEEETLLNQFYDVNINPDTEQHKTTNWPAPLMQKFSVKLDQIFHSQMGYIPGKQSTFNSWKIICAICHITSWKKKSQVINCYKNKIKHPSRVRTLSIPGAKQELYQLHKKQPQIPSANKPVVTKISFFPLNTEIRQGCLSSSYYHEVREIKGI